MTDQPVAEVPAGAGISSGVAVPPGAAGAVETAADVQPPAAQSFGRIPFRLRIGVIGHINLSDSEELRAGVRRAIECAIAQTWCRSGPRPATPVTLTVVSSLAEGADRIVVEEVLKIPGSRLVSVLPVYRDDIDVYRSDFKTDESVREFNAYQEIAWRCISPPASSGVISKSGAGAGRPENAAGGYSKEERAAGYQWAARAVARNCDVLIAVWDEEASRGTGGTADTMGWLQERDLRDHQGKPVPESSLAALGSATAMLVLSTDEPFVVDTAGPLRIIVPAKGDPEPRVDDSLPAYRRAAGSVRTRLAEELVSLDRLNRKKFSPSRWSKAEADARKYLTTEESLSYPRLRGIVDRIMPPLIRADELAKVASRHFLALSYLQICSTAAATVIAALEAVVFPGTWGLTVGEIVFLLASLSIVVAESRWKTHERWTAYRFLAERLRSVYYVLAAGVRPEAERETKDAPIASGQHGWIERAFAEVLAEQEPGNGQQATEPAHVLDDVIRGSWISGQIDYFRKTSRRLIRRHNTVRTLLAAVLFVTIAAAIMHSLDLWSLPSTETEAFSMCAIALPALAAALANIRSLREFTRHASRYANMATVLDWYLDQYMADLNADHLRLLALSVYDVLTAESRGWLGAVTGHGIEIG
jgi:hypothetical protein